MSDQSNLPRPSAVKNGAYLFLSYHSLDQRLIQSIQASLSGRGVDTFLDRNRLKPGLPWVDALQEGIDKSCAVAVFIGKEGLGAWQKREMELALQRQAKEGKFPVVPVLLPQADVEKAPGFLLLNTWIDLRGGVNDIGLDNLAEVVRGDAVSMRPVESDSLPPYRALLVFREEDARLFYGREIPAEELRKKTLTSRLVAVVGPSGSGKSSIVQAGLFPLLRRESTPSWEIIHFTPGNYPFHNLAAALLPILETQFDKTQVLVKAGELGESWKNGAPLEMTIKQMLTGHLRTDRLLICVDQFEELFTLTLAAERLPFVNALLEAIAATQTTLLFTLRADFYSHAISLSRDLSDLIQEGLINIGPMRREELRRSIENPAMLVGLKFETGLVNRVLDHVASQPGSLPLLEFALTELWKKREGKQLTNAGYDEIGGVEGAISKRAEELFNSLSLEQQEVSLQLLSRLVRVAGPGEEGTDTRLRVKMSELDISMRSVAQSFVQARLLVVDRDPGTSEETIEVAHEALILRWDRLNELLNQDREFMLWRRRLRLRLTEWQLTRAEDNELLLQGAGLAEARQWLKIRKRDLIEDEKEYIRSSSRQDPKSDTWHGQLDLTNYAIIIAIAAILFVFSSPNNPHFVLLISSLLITFLLFMEASSYQLWTEALAEDLGWSTNSISWFQAARLRLRNYFWILALLAACWNLKVYLSPLPARDFNAFVDRATVGLLPGWVVVSSSILFLVGLLLCGLGNIHTSHKGSKGHRDLLRSIDAAEANAKRTQWLQMISYAILAIGAVFALMFSSPNNPHFVVFISFPFITYFLFKEATYYRLWSTSLAKNAIDSTYSLSWVQSVGLRLWRNYLWIFAVLLGGWALKVYISPLPSRDLGAFLDRATVGPLEGWVITTVSIVVYVGLVIFALLTKRGDEKSLLPDIPLTEAKQWLEKTTTYVLVTSFFIVTFAFSSPNIPNLILPITSILISFFLLRGASYYRIWTNPLTVDSTASTYTTSGWKAVGLRMRRSYLLSFILLFGCWILKLYLSPLPAGNIDVFFERASYGVIPGWLLLIWGIILNAGIFIFVLPSFRFGPQSQKQGSH